MSATREGVAKSKVHTDIIADAHCTAPKQEGKRGAMRRHYFARCNAHSPSAQAADVATIAHPIFGAQDRVHTGLFIDDAE
jgi:hypothetical protein